MNKNDLVASVASGAGLSKSEAAKAVDAVFGSISSSLSGGNEVRLVGFGTFSVTRRRATEGRNPRTGDNCLLYTSPSPRDATLSRMPSSA